jgi:hypothetical protein
MAILNLPPLINGVAYTHADIVLVISGIPIIGCTGINYSDKQMITPNYSTSQKATSVGFGKVENAGSVTLTLEAVEVLQALAANNGGRIQNLPFFNVDISFFSAEGGIFIHHRLVKCRFTGRNPDSSVDNSQIEETLELFIGDIDYQTV